MNDVAVAVRDVNAAKMNRKGDNIMKLIDEKQAAAWLGCTVSAMRKWRLLGRGPAYCRIGRLIRYNETDLIAFMDANRVQPTTAEVVR